MAGKVSSRNATVLVGGYVLSPMAFSYEASGPSVDPIDVTGFGDGSQNYIPGQLTSGMTCNFYWDQTATTGANVALRPLGNKAVTIIPETYTLGGDAVSMWAMQENWSPKGDPNSAITVESVKFTATGAWYAAMEGQMLHNSAITTTTTGTGVRDWTAADMTAISAGVLHVWTPTATDTYVVKIQHSSDNSTSWTDLVTFTLNGTARNSEIVAGATTTLKQYRRILATRTGAAGDSFGFSVFFWRQNA